MLKPCCLIPVLWSVTGGGIGALQVFEPLAPYGPYFIAVTAVLLTVAFFQVYFRVPEARLESIRTSVHRSRSVLWFATAVFVMATVYPIIAPHPQHATSYSAAHHHE